MVNPEQDMLFTSDIDGVRIREMLQSQKGLIAAIGGFAARRYSFGGDAYDRTGEVPEYPSSIDMATMVSDWAAYYGSELTKVAVSGWEDVRVNPVQVYGWIKGLEVEQDRLDSVVKHSEVTHG